MAAVADAVSELYRAPLEEFVATRTLLARRLKQDGDAAAALAITARRKPSVSTWLVNQLSAGAPGQVRELLAAASGIRDASGARGAGDGVREASSRFRGALDAVARELRRSLEASGRGVADDTLRRALLTAHAAGVGDPGMRESLLRGVVDCELEPPGFGAPGSGEDDTPLVRAAIAGLITGRPPLRVDVSAPTSASATKRRAERDAATAWVDADVRRMEREAMALEEEADRLTAHAQRLRERAGRLAGEARDVAGQAAAAEEAMTRAQEAARRARDELAAPALRRRGGARR